MILSIYTLKNPAIWLVKTILAHDLRTIILKAHPGKYHVILSSNTQREIHFNNTSIASSLSEKLLRITLETQLKFEEHITKICNIVNKKLNASYYKPNQLRQKKNSLRVFIESQFSYCPVIWIFHSKTLNKKINQFFWINYPTKWIASPMLSEG